MGSNCYTLRWSLNYVTNLNLQSNSQYHHPTPSDIFVKELPITHCAGFYTVVITLYWSSLYLTDIPTQLWVYWELNYVFILSPLARSRACAQSKYLIHSKGTGFDSFLLLPQIHSPCFSICFLPWGLTCMADIIEIPALWFLVGSDIRTPTRRSSEGERSVRSGYLFPWFPSCEVT